jgi:hypothetical protein
MAKTRFFCVQQDGRVSLRRRLGLFCGLVLAFLETLIITKAAISVGSFSVMWQDSQVVTLDYGVCGRRVLAGETLHSDGPANSDGDNQEIPYVTLRLLRDDSQTPQEWGDLAEETLWIEAVEIDVWQLNQTTSITVQVTAMNTGKQISLSLPYDASRGAYLGSVPVEQIVSELEGLTAAALVYGGDEPDEFDYDVAREFMDRLGVPPQNRLGVAFSTGSLEGEPVDWIPPTNLNFFRAAGYELIKVEVLKGESEEVWGFIKNQADILLYIGHGKHLDNMVFLDDTAENQGRPQNIRGTWDVLDTVMLFGCSVLDIGDQNGWWLFDLKEHNSSPGKAWVDLGPEHWLGFQAAAPRVHTQYGYNMIYAWASLYAGGGDAENSWRIASDWFMPGELGMGAVANDTQLYFYWEQFDWCLFGIWPCWDAYTWRSLPRALWEAEVESLEGLLASPADVHLYDPLGRHLGPDGAGGFDAEIPGSATWLGPLANEGEEEVKARRVSVLGADLSHGYNLQLKGTNAGNFHFLLEVPDQVHGQLLPRGLPDRASEQQGRLFYHPGSRCRLCPGPGCRW